MSEHDVIDGEAEELDEPGQEIVVRTPTAAPATIFGTDDPALVVAKATEAADALMAVVRAKNLVVRIRQKEHPLVEAWTLLGSMVGVYPVVEWTRPIMSLDGKAIVGWEARVEAKTKAGEVVGAAEAECLRAESRWKSADDYAVRSMAQTRAISKALRMPLGFIMQLAGLSATPAEEMDGTAPSGDFSEAAAAPADDPKEHAKAVRETRKLLKPLSGREGWGEEEVCGQAARIWGKPVSALEDLSIDELREIAKAAKGAAPS